VLRSWLGEAERKRYSDSQLRQFEGVPNRGEIPVPTNLVDGLSSRPLCNTCPTPHPPTPLCSNAIDIERFHVRATPQGCDHMARLGQHTENWEPASDS
jgi:hypothetical protein